eukprot:2427939-Pleurochrysis_carterae.AAC.1
MALARSNWRPSPSARARATPKRYVHMPTPSSSPLPRAACSRLLSQAPPLPPRCCPFALSPSQPKRTVEHT